MSSPLDDLPYKAIAVCIMEINLSAPAASLNNSQPVSHEPVVTPPAAAALMHFVLKVASGPEKKTASKMHPEQLGKNEGALGLNEGLSLCPHVVQKHTTSI